MSINYADKILLASGKVTTPTNGDIVDMIPSLTNDYLVTSVMVIVETAGAQSATGLTIETAEASPTEVHALVIGTTAADTSLKGDVAEASRLVTAGTGLQLKAVTTDASAVYHYRVFGTNPSC